MTNRENVILGIENCLQTDSVTECSRTECPFIECRETCLEWLLRSALALLKEQEARVMTLEEVKAFDWDYCYLEEERLPGKAYRAVCGDYALTCITWQCVGSMRIHHGDNNYGKKWRCWSAKPTDEQRKAVKWDAADFSKEKEWEKCINRKS